MTKRTQHIMNGPIYGTFSQLFFAFYRQNQLSRFNSSKFNTAKQSKISNLLFSTTTPPTNLSLFKDDEGSNSQQR